MAAYHSDYSRRGNTTRGHATRFICCWCKKTEKTGEKWGPVGPISAEEKIGYRCCPACDTKKRGERLPKRPKTPADP